jgi:3-mercaptopyruvate sulfurtransferase SseA
MTIPTIDRTTLLNLMACDRTWLIHADGPRSFRQAHLPGAIRFDTIDHAIAVLRPDDPIVVYGRDDGSPNAPRWVSELLRNGFPRARWYAEGLAGWQTAGGRIEGADDGANPLHGP